MSTPAVSVVMPVRNGERFLDEALRSIRAQTFDDLEIVAVDDGSTDATPDILRRHQAEDPRMRLVRQAASGIAAALNRGLAEARAPLVARIDADDLALPERLARQVAVLDADPSVGLVGSSVDVIDGAGRVLRREHLPTTADEIRRALPAANPIAHPTVLMRRDPVLGLGGYRPQFRLCEDYDLWLRLSERCDLMNVAEPLLQLREHPGQSAWRGLERRFLSELGAQLSSRHRSTGKADPFAALGAITRTSLREAGLEDRAIAARIGARAEDSAREAIRAGHPAAARTAIALGLRQPGLDLRASLRLARLAVKSLLPHR